MKWIKLFESFDKINSIAIIGGGISSLYAAYKIKKEFPDIKYTILEKSSEIGGRVKMDEIDGVKINTGAQFLRVSKDKALLKLIDDLGIKVSAHNFDVDYAFKKSNIDPMIEKLKSRAKDYDRSKINFGEFAKEVLRKDFEIFINMMGYTDYLKSDLIDALENYGLDDNMPGYKYSNIDWSEVLAQLTKEIGKKNIKLNTEVKSIKKKKGGFVINSDIECDAVIIGVTVNQLRKLIDHDIYSQIQSQNFIKVFAKTGDLEVDKYTVLDSELRKIVPYGNDVFNIAFSDNADAKKLKDKGLAYFQNKLKYHFSDDIKLAGLKKFYWEEGTHYFKPLPDKWKSREEFIYDAQHPDGNIWVIGEMVAKKQGWVNGALDSVDNISLFKKD